MRALDNGPSAAYGRVMKSDAVDKKSTERSGYSGGASNRFESLRADGDN